MGTVDVHQPSNILLILFFLHPLSVLCSAISPAFTTLRMWITWLSWDTFRPLYSSLNTTVPHSILPCARSTPLPLILRIHVPLPPPFSCGGSPLCDDGVFRHDIHELTCSAAAHRRKIEILVLPVPQSCICMCAHMCLYVGERKSASGNRG